MDTIQRLNYFTSQFLVEADFQGEQDYHRNMRLLHNKSLHTFGVVNGLTVKGSGNQIQVTQGMAIDKDGREIVLLSDSGSIPLNAANTDVFITIEYTEMPDVLDTTSGVANKYRRTTEKYEVKSSTIKPLTDGSVIQLARVKVDQGGNILEIHNEERISAGAVIPSNSIATDQLKDGSITTTKIAPKAIGTDQLVDGSVTATKIADEAVGTAKLATASVTADKIALNAFVVRSLNLDGANLPFLAVTTALINDVNAIHPAKIADIKITVPSKGVVIVTASGHCAGVTIPAGTVVQYLLGLRSATETNPSVDYFSIYMDTVAGMSTTVPFSLTKVFPVTDPTVQQTYQLVGALGGQNLGVILGQKQNRLGRFTLTALFVPCSTDLSEA